MTQQRVRFAADEFVIRIDAAVARQRDGANDLGTLAHKAGVVQYRDRGGKYLSRSAPENWIPRMMCRIISEAEFSAAIRHALAGVECDCAMGPGRSGALASIYASHILGVPFLPYGLAVPEGLSRLLIIDTASATGRTLRKMLAKYPGAQAIAIFSEPPRVKFWYEFASRHPDGMPL